MQDRSKISTDAALMSRIAQKDAAAFDFLCAQHLDRAYRSAAALLGGTAHAEDIAQEAFLKLWKQAPKWTATAQVSTWLHRVIYNLCIDKLRHDKRYSDAEVPEQLDTAPTPIDTHIHKEQSDMLFQALSQLPTRQRLAIVLVHYEESTNIEAAQRMEISVDALESLLARARKRLKEILTPQRDLLYGDVK